MVWGWSTNPPPGPAVRGRAGADPGVWSAGPALRAGPTRGGRRGLVRGGAGHLLERPRGPVAEGEPVGPGLGLVAFERAGRDDRG